MTRTFLASFGILALLAPSASAQAVAFRPGVASFPNGVSMSVTPVVSADRRYVRLGVSPYFTGLQGFDTFSVPAAVGGGGFGGLGGGVGFAGMDGPIDGMTAIERRLSGFASPHPTDAALGHSTPPRWRQQRTMGPRAEVDPEARDIAGGTRRAHGRDRAHGSDTEARGGCVPAEGGVLSVAAGRS